MLRMSSQICNTNKNKSKENRKYPKLLWRNFEQIDPAQIPHCKLCGVSLLTVESVVSQPESPHWRLDSGPRQHTTHLQHTHTPLYPLYILTGQNPNIFKPIQAIDERTDDVPGLYSFVI